jgi:hypothetical protein
MLFPRPGLLFTPDAGTYGTVQVNATCMSMPARIKGSLQPHRIAGLARLAQRKPTVAHAGIALHLAAGPRVMASGYGGLPQGQSTRAASAAPTVGMLTVEMCPSQARVQVRVHVQRSRRGREGGIGAT